MRAGDVRCNWDGKFWDLGFLLIFETELDFFFG